MIAHLRGAIHRLDPGEIVVDVQGVGYGVSVPVSYWDALEEGQIALVWTHTYVREDRLDLFGFADRAGRTLFEEFLKMPGIGPKTALELCAVPRPLLHQAVAEQDERLLRTVKGIGQKSAEKLLVELKSLFEKRPDLFGSPSPSMEGSLPGRHEFDQDAVAALASLGYDRQTILKTLRDLPTEIKTTEERVTAALRSL